MITPLEPSATFLRRGDVDEFVRETGWLRSKGGAHPLMCAALRAESTHTVRTGACAG
jgi:hypothetical protein